MITFYVLGAFAFVMFILYDINQIKGNVKKYNLLFPFGIAMLLGLTILITVESTVTYNFSKYLIIVFWALAVAFFILLCYTLFFAVPFDAAYLQGSKQKLSTHGVYGVCRHPGVLFLAGAYIFLALALGRQSLLIAGVVFTIYNIIYVVVQDQWIFPIIFEGYDDYKKSTHFLVPLGRKHHN